MVDMAFLLVSFFMLTTTFKTMEPFTVERPSSQSETKIPERNVATLSIDQQGRVFFSVDGKFTRQRLIQRMAQRYQQDISSEAKEQFSLLSSFGLPMAALPDFLRLSPDVRAQQQQPGIPCDADANELADWLVQARLCNPKLRFSINADKKTPYEKIERVIETLTAHKIYRFNLVTELESAS